jgi:hypothetical protein
MNSIARSGLNLKKIISFFVFAGERVEYSSVAGKKKKKKKTSLCSNPWV